MSAYRVEFASAAVRAFEELPRGTRARIRRRLEQLARAAAIPGQRHGKAVKTIRGRADSFYRLRVGDYRVMYDVLHEDRVILVLGIVHRGELERWLRNR
ncbi:MAG TPA: type II toxin-antitoxin system RelE/ParE family toxin [Actinomycetota bacterium]|nr:type II toxin-antitoxin system RelE/ParE family toxin [Actinomycetota bacterium]